MGPIGDSLLATGLGMGIDALFGKNPETMTPEERKIYEYVMAELSKTDMGLGYSPNEKMTMQHQLKNDIGEYTRQQIGRSEASVGRRGGFTASTGAAIRTGAQANAGKAYGQGLTDIDLASMNAGRQRRAQLTTMLPGLGGQLPQQPDFAGGLSDYIAKIMALYSQKKKEPDTSSVWGY